MPENDVSAGNNLPIQQNGMSSIAVQELVESNLAMEKVSVELLDGMTKLMERIDRMLGVFEGAAKKIDEGELLREPLAKQLVDLLEQNKTIARGLLVLEKYIRERSGELKELPRTVSYGESGR